MKRKWMWFVLCWVGVLVVDQGTKMWIRHRLPLTTHNMPVEKQTKITVIPKVFELRRVENPYGLWSLFRSYPRLRIVQLPLALLCMVLLAVWLVKLPPTALRSAGKLGLLAGGAVGNIGDLLLHGGVTDFIVWKLPNPVYVGRWTLYEWPTFNIADVALVVGVLMLLLNIPKDPALIEPSKKSK